MERDAKKMRGQRPFVFTNLKTGSGVDTVVSFIQDKGGLRSLMLSFTRHFKDRTDQVTVKPDTLIVAGWTGRDEAALRHHIEELAAIGVPRPSSVPVFYRNAVNNVMQTERLEVLGPDTSGEVEPVVVVLDDGMWIGLGSDHTDRKAETMGIALSKQLCGKVMGPALWRLEDITRHWDQIVIRSHATIGGERVVYQEGALAAMRHPDDLIARYGKALAAEHDHVLRHAWAQRAASARPSRFEMELDDPVLERRMTHALRRCRPAGDHMSRPRPSGTGAGPHRRSERRGRARLPHGLCGCGARGGGRGRRAGEGRHFARAARRRDRQHQGPVRRGGRADARGLEDAGDDAPPATADAPVVRRLRAAGAVIVAKTSMSEFAFSGVGMNPHYGTPGNPADRARVPGGSSSGAAVAAADRMCEIAIGTDTGGSTRIPGGAVRHRRLQAEQAARADRRRVPAVVHARSRSVRWRAAWRTAPRPTP